MNRSEAEDFVYRSYLKAEKFQDYYAKDADKRRPDVTREIIRKRAGTPCTVVTGSKGKGSVANMISQILQTELHVGLMTSPHIENFCERFRLDGVPVTDADFSRYMTLLQPEFEAVEATLPPSVGISPMGIQAAFALRFFNDKKTDFNVMECGKGAKYDDVNNVLHEYAVINRILTEHTRELGDTIEDIAKDKACVITGEQKYIYVARQKESVKEIIVHRAGEFGTPVKYYGKDFWAENIRYTNSGMLFDVVIDGQKYENISLPLMGEHQAENCALAMALCKDVLEQWNMDKVKSNLERLKWPGRLEVMSSQPFVLLDACIHSASCRNVKDVLWHLGIKKAAVINGIPMDKDYVGVAREMQSMAQTMILTKSQNPHYVFSKEQSENLAKIGITSMWTDSVEEAIREAKETNLPIIILGTTSVVAEVEMCFR